MDSVSDICKYHFLCFMTIIEAKVMSGHQEKRSSKKNSWFRAAIHVFRSDFCKEREKWPWNTFWSIKIGQNIKLGKSRWSPEMTWKVPVFDMFYVISQPFFEDIDLKCCTHIHQSLPSNISSVSFENFVFEGVNFEKEKKLLKIWKFWRIFKIFKIQDSSFVAPLILRHFI